MAFSTSAEISRNVSPSAGPIEWLPVAVGLLALYLPTFWAYSTTIWKTEEHAHGPLVLLIVIWLIWDRRQFFREDAKARASFVGWSLVIAGVFCYVVGRSQSIPILDIGSFLPVGAGAVLVLRGWNGLKSMWFPLFFAAFAIPLPGLLVDAATGTLKQSVSAIAETLLYAGGYPIARSGVVLNVGQYQLMVADACSGLNSMISLGALALLYIYVMHYRSYSHAGLLLASVLPIAFAANVVRVVILVLVTYHFGDEAGQGFAHVFAGMVLFAVALIMLWALDGLLRLMFRSDATK